MVVVRRPGHSLANVARIVELTPAGRDLAQNTPVGGIGLLRHRLGTLSTDRLHLLDEALAEIMRLMEVTDIDE